MEVPGRRRWAKLTPSVVGLLEAADDWVDLDAICGGIDASDRPDACRALGTLVDLGVLVEDDAGDAVPSMWRHWGELAQRFHVDTRDANYLVDSQERVDVVEAMLGEGHGPPGFKEYPDHPVLMLPRRPLPLRSAVEDVFTARRTHRRFADTPLTIDELSTLLFYSFAPQRFVDGGQFGPQQCRVAASAGARHEVEAYVVVYAIDGVAPGLYHYAPRQHALELLDPDADRERVAAMVYDQEPSFAGAVTVLTTAVADRLAWKYRHPRAYRLWMYDAGHYGQAFALACAALGLGAFQTIAFVDTEVEQFLGVDPDEEFAAYLLAAGRPEPHARHDIQLPVDFAHPAPATPRVGWAATG